VAEVDAARERFEVLFREHVAGVASYCRWCAERSVRNVCDGYRPSMSDDTMPSGDDFAESKSPKDEDKRSDEEEAREQAADRDERTVTESGGYGTERAKEESSWTNTVDCDRLTRPSLG
jgi:hypothetical protein